MKYIYLAAVFSLVTLPALAQQPPPVLDLKSFIDEVQQQRSNCTTRADNLEAQYHAAVIAYEARLTEALSWLKQAQEIKTGEAK